ncbi:MAG TPA: metallophosphoesterase family protein [Coriobacteriia bacterium]|nr:metallophosphoesterase family protein [Coriobacteriia bacterium]
MTGPMRRIALFADVHGNSVALDAVMRDIDDTGVAERYCLGDLVGYGPDPVGVIERLRVRGYPVVRGNYDQGVGNRSGTCGCYYATDRARSDGAASYEFTARAVGDDDAAWLAGLPPELRFDEAGVRVVLTHGSPRRINEYLMPDRVERQLARLARDAEADVVCSGHVHIPYHRSFPAALDDPSGPVVHYVNAGSVGKPKDGDPRACWVELLIGRADEVREAAPDDRHAARAGTSDAWVGMVVHRVDYDVEPVVSAMAAAGLPSTLADALRSG